jgi:uncharacterized protein (TIGR02145 family)
VKHLFFLLVLTNFSFIQIEAQIIKGKLVDENNLGLSEVNLVLYLLPETYNTISASDGTFSFTINGISGVEDNLLPAGYAVSDNFPNPFNPRTRINITLPNSANVKLEVFNLLGETITQQIEQNFNAGVNFIDIELNGLPNGLYISRITIDDKYAVVKKMMLVYGSQHLNTGRGVQMTKSTEAFHEIILDSLVATSNIIGSKTFTDLPVFTGGTLDLGNFTIERYCPGSPSVMYEDKLYNTVQIGNQCWLKENLDIGTMIPGSQDQTNNQLMEKYCYDNDPNNCNIYGGLYQWNEAMQYVNTPGSRGICPLGWHIPTLAEYDILKTLVNDDSNALKREDQGMGYGQGTNLSGFSALLAGSRNLSGSFGDLGRYTTFWSSSEYYAEFAYYINLYYYGGQIRLGASYYRFGDSVRCLKD